MSSPRWCNCSVPTDCRGTNLSPQDHPVAFVDRDAERSFLDGILRRNGPTPGELVLLYGRRRIGKSRLLLHWAESCDLPFVYWVADREGATLQRRKLYARVAGLKLHQAPLFDSWAELWDALATLLEGRPPQVLILDELPYAAESDPAMLSSLQNAWDRRLQHLDLVVALCGSQVRTMEALQSRQSPLFGRLTGQWRLGPLPFDALGEFLPSWSMADRVRTWAIVGGVPAYLQWLDARRSLLENLRDVVLAPGSMFVAEPMFLLYDEVRDPRSYLSILRAIGSGSHSLDEVARTCLINKAHLSSYLATLQELGLVERRLPATLTPAARAKSRRGRYHLCDPYFRFYFRFIAPNADLLPFDRRPTLEAIRQGLPGFVGETAFEELARQWVMTAGRAGRLGFVPSQVGAHWSRKVQVDVVAADHATRNLVIGECKWGAAPVEVSAVQKLLEHTGPRLLGELPDGGDGWLPSYVFFARGGFTEGASRALAQVGAEAVDLDGLEAGLRGSSPRV